jgi:hypothetical protein
VLCGCGGGSSATSTAAARPAPAPALGQVRIVPRVGRRTTFALTAPWFISYDARGRHIERAAARAATLTLAGATDLIISSTPAALLLHRLAELHARLKPGQFPVGADTHDHLHVNSTYWTSGFWPGALWQAAALAPDHGMIERWPPCTTSARSATTPTTSASNTGSRRWRPIWRSATRAERMWRCARG